MKARFAALMSALALALTLGLWLAPSGTAYAQDATRTALAMNTLRVGAVNRSIGLYVPHTYRTGRPAPLIIALHGRFSSAQALHAISHLSGVAEANGAIVAYPETQGASWNDGGFGPLARTETPPDDDAFIDAAINAIAQEYALDRQRIFLVGYDSGGAMAYALACRGSPTIAGVAVVSAPLFDFTARACAHGR